MPRPAWERRVPLASPRRSFSFAQAGGPVRRHLAGKGDASVRKLARSPGKGALRCMTTAGSMLELVSMTTPQILAFAVFAVVLATFAFLMQPASRKRH
jgi:hypothetical protein